MKSETKLLIREAASELDIADEIRSEALSLYEEASTNRYTNGKSPQQNAGGCLYLACRKNGDARTLTEVGEQVGVGKQEIGAAAMSLSQSLDLPLTPVQATSYVPRFADELPISDTVEERAAEILEEVSSDPKVNDRSPTGKAASALYISSQQNGGGVTQKSVAEVAGVTTTTIRDTAREMRQLINLV